MDWIKSRERETNYASKDIRAKYLSKSDVLSLESEVYKHLKFYRLRAKKTLNWRE
jgi:hypothetical protein